MNFEFDYGDLFFGDMGKALDYFDFDLQLNFSDTKLIGGPRCNGLLGGTFLKETDRAAHIVAGVPPLRLHQQLQVEFGAQSLGTGFMSRFESASGMEMRTEVHGNAHHSRRQRIRLPQHLRPELRLRTGCSVGLRGRIRPQRLATFRVRHAQSWIHAVNGNDCRPLPDRIPRCG